MWGTIIGAGIAAGGSLLGGMLGNAQSAANNAAQMRFAREQLQFQKDAAQMGIRWKVADAQAAGLHPLFALSGQTFHPSPIGLQQSSSDYSYLGRMGQDVGRAVQAGLSKEEKPPKYDSIDQLLEVQQDKQLQRDYIASQTLVNNARAAQITASIPTPGSTDPNNPASIAGVPSSQDKSIAPYVQWVDAGNVLLPFPAKDLKVEDEFGAPLMAEHIIRNRVQPFLGGAAITPPPAVWKKKWPDAIGIRWAKLGYVPVYPPNDPRSRHAPVAGPVTGGGSVNPYVYRGGVQGEGSGIFMP